MHAFSDNAVSQQGLATPSIATSRASETVLSAASATDRLLILKEGAVKVIKESFEIAKVHTADVHALEGSKFHFVSTSAPLMRDPVALPYVATVVERREDSANRPQVELKCQVKDGQLSSITCKTVDNIDETLGASGGNLVYGGYPYDPFVLEPVNH